MFQVLILETVAFCTDTLSGIMYLGPHMLKIGNALTITETQAHPLCFCTYEEQLLEYSVTHTMSTDSVAVSLQIEPSSVSTDRLYIQL